MFTSGLLRIGVDQGVAVLHEVADQRGVDVGGGVDLIQWRLSPTPRDR
jgi:hypothetical protein